MATKTLALPDLFRAEGINVEVMDGWEKPHIIGGRPYVWRAGDDPTASMWHHTATAAYTPNRSKANMYAGLMHAGSQRLYQSGGGVPTIVIANAWPGPITSGYGQQGVHDLCLDDIPNDRLATGPDDVPRWAGNRSYWNTETILDGIGTWIDEEVWSMITTAATVLHELYGWSVHRAIGHAQHTRRKPDMWSGQDPSVRETMIRFRNSIGDEMSYEQFRADEFDLWTDGNIMEAWDAGMFQDPNRDGFEQYWVTDRADRTDSEKARFLTDYYAHLWK